MTKTGGNCDTAEEVISTSGVGGVDLKVFCLDICVIHKSQNFCTFWHKYITLLDTLIKY